MITYVSTILSFPLAYFAARTYLLKCVHTHTHTHTHTHAHTHTIHSSLLRDTATNEIKTQAHDGYVADDVEEGQESVVRVMIKKK